MTDTSPRDQVDTLRTKLRNGDRYVQFEPDRDHLLRASDNIRLLQSELGEHRHLKILRHNTRIASLAPPPTVGDFRANDELEKAGISDEDDVQKLMETEGLLGAALEYRAAAESVVRWIHDEYSNEHTNQDYRTTFRSFGRYRRKLQEPPESLAWIPTSTSNSFDPTPSERDLLKYHEEVIPMIESCLNPRDKALIAVQFEAGARGGELYDLRRGDVYDGEYTTGIHVDGKEGERPVSLINSVPYLQHWLDEETHPAGDDETAYLWSKRDSPERPSYKNFLDIFKNAASRAGVQKDVTPTNFRKSNTRWLVLLGFSQPRIEDRQGRTRGSKHTARYVARFGKESNEVAYARLHGLDVDPDEDSQESGPVECPRCHRNTPAHKTHCMWCDFALSYEAVEDREATQEAAVDEMVDADEPGARAMYAEFIKFLNENPHRIPENAQDLVTSPDSSSS